MTIRVVTSRRMEVEPEQVDQLEEDEPESQEKETKSRPRNAPQNPVREQGKSCLPIARVQKIMKADRVCRSTYFSDVVELKE